MVILISGASRGIGASLARQLTVSGHKVLLVSRNRARLEKVVAQCNEEAGAELAHSIPFDLGDLSDLEEEFVSHLKAISGKLDALVNNAGRLINKPFLDTTAAEGRALFEANFFAPAALTRICLPFMKASSLKHVVNISSMGGFQGSAKFPGLSYYSASKAALGNLTECLAEELKEDGIAMNALALGAVQTEMLEEAFPGYKAPLKPDQMAEFMSWFILEGGRFFNGKILPVSLSSP